MRKWIDRLLRFFRIKTSFRLNPSDYEVKLLEKATLKVFKPTIESINGIAKGGTYNIQLTYRTINDIKTTKKFQTTIIPDNQPGVKFVIDLPEMPDVPGVLHKESYGLSEALQLENKELQLYIPPDSVQNFETKFPAKPQFLKGRFTTIHSSNRYPKTSYCRQLIPVVDTDMTFPTSILDYADNHMKFDVASWDRQMSLIGLPFFSTKGMYATLIIKDKEYHFYAIEQIKSFVIDSLDKIDINTFKRIAYSIRLSFAFLSGKFYKNEAILVTSSKPDFSSVDFYEYHMEEDSILTGNQIINPTFFFQEYERAGEETKEQWREYHEMFDNNVFSQICEKILESTEFARSLELVINAGNIKDPIQKGALYSVSLETLTELIKNENIDALKPISKEKNELWKQLHKESKESLGRIKDEIPENSYNILDAKIDNLNSPTNRDKLEKPFKLLGVDLSKDEINTLGQRNNYLHGGQPDDKEWVTLSNLNALKIHSLFGILVLKLFNYKGHYFNVEGWFLLQNREANKLFEDLDFNELDKVIVKLRKREFKTRDEMKEAKQIIERFMKFSIAGETIRNFLRII